MTDEEMIKTIKWARREIITLRQELQAVKGLLMEAAGYLDDDEDELFNRIRETMKKDLVL